MRINEVVDKWTIYRFLADDIKLQPRYLVKYLRFVGLDEEKYIEIGRKHDLITEKDDQVVNAAIGKIVEDKYGEVKIIEDLVDFYNLDGYEFIAVDWSNELETAYGVYKKSKK